MRRIYLTSPERLVTDLAGVTGIKVVVVPDEVGPGATAHVYETLEDLQCDTDKEKD